MITFKSMKLSMHSSGATLVRHRYGRLVSVEPTIQGMAMVVVDVGDGKMMGILPFHSINAELNQSVEITLTELMLIESIRGVNRHGH